MKPKLRSLAKNDYKNLKPIERKRKFKIDTNELNQPSSSLGRTLQSKKSSSRPNSRSFRPVIKLDNLNSKDPFGLKKGNLANLRMNEEEHCYQQIELSTLPIKILSPNYGKGSYASNTNCIYNLTSAETPYNLQIKLNIINLDLEDSKTCERDYLAIQNGTRFCGDLKNKIFYLNQSSAILSFKSDLVTENDGFEIELSIESPYCKSLITLNEFEQELTSPNWPNNYPDSMDCWTLINGENLQLEFNAKNPGYDDDLSIAFTFTDLSMEPDSLCNIDYVELFEVNQDDLEPRASLGRFCDYGKYIRIVGDKKNKKNQLVTMGNQVHTRNAYLYLHFKTDKLINSRGFKAKIEMKEKLTNKLNHTCDWKADSVSKKVISPLFPQPYPSNIDCSVLLEAPDDQFVLLTFERFILEPGKI